MGERRKARELALQLAYQIDLESLSIGDLDRAFSEMPVRSVKVKDFARYLVEGTWLNLKEIDRAIIRCTENWEPKRMAVVDRNILRVASFEILYAEEIPPKATINEWIEVAKKYSTEYSGSFINGVLDRLKRDYFQSKEEKRIPAETQVEDGSADHS